MIPLIEALLARGLIANDPNLSEDAAYVLAHELVVSARREGYELYAERESVEA